MTPIADRCGRAPRRAARRLRGAASRLLAIARSPGGSALRA
jgi:hypothetical protein